MKITNILIIFSLISITHGVERKTSIPERYLDLYRSSIDTIGEIRGHKLYNERLDYVLSKIMKERFLSRKFLIEVRDLYEEGVIFAYQFAKEYFGELLTEDEYDTLTYNNVAHKSFWERIYRNFSQ